MLEYLSKYKRFYDGQIMSQDQRDHRANLMALNINRRSSYV